MNRTAIVLGAGAQNGLGAAIAREFAENGHHTIVAGRTLEKVALVAADIEGKGGSAEGFSCDVTSQADITTLMCHAATTGAVDAVIYNAGNNAIIPFEVNRPGFIRDSFG